jgi:tripartite-type tricarboxylate transporter receptor subunit TctC
MSLEKQGLKSVAVAVLSSLLVFLSSSSGFSQAPFYQRKTITVIGGDSPGGFGDIRTKVVLAYLRKHIPGNPTIVTQYMAGGGGQKLTNHIYHNVRPDGLTIGRPSSAFVQSAALDEPGVKYKINDFVYLGSAISRNRSVFYTRKEVGLANIEQLQAASALRIGSQSVGHPVYVRGRLIAWLLGLKEPAFIPAYSSPELELALQRGEVDGRVAGIEGILSNYPEYVEKGLMDFHVTLNVPHGQNHPHSRFTSLPEIDTFAKTEIEQKLLSVFRVFRGVGDPFILPPGIPREQVKILRYAMRKSFEDPEFKNEFKKVTGDDPTPLFPEEQEKMIKEMSNDRRVIQLYKTIAGSGPLPSR